MFVEHSAFLFMLSAMIFDDDLQRRDQKVESQVVDIFAPFKASLLAQFREHFNQRIKSGTVRVFEMPVGSKPTGVEVLKALFISLNTKLAALQGS